MNGYKPFSEFLEQNATSHGDTGTSPRDVRAFDRPVGSPFHDDPPQPDTMDDEAQVEERSTFRNPFVGVFKAVNLAGRSSLDRSSRARRALAMN